MDFMTSVNTCISKFADFTGRAQRSELWWFFLATTIVSIILTILDTALFSGLAAQIGVLSTIFSLAVLIPSLSVGARRLHDVGRSGWWQLLILIPLLGWAVLLYFFATKGTDGDNAFGADPLV